MRGYVGRELVTVLFPTAIWEDYCAQVITITIESQSNLRTHPALEGGCGQYQGVGRACLGEK